MMDYEKEINDLKKQLSVFRGIALFALTRQNAIRELVDILAESQGVRLHESDDFLTVLSRMEREHTEKFLPWFADFSQVDASVIKKVLDEIEKELNE